MVNNLTFAEGIDHLQLLTAFPSFHALNCNTLQFLLDGSRVNFIDDTFLDALTAHGICDLGTNRLRFDNVSEQALINFAFGGYEDGGRVRTLKANKAQVSAQFLQNFAQVRLWL